MITTQPKIETKPVKVKSQLGMVFLSQIVVTDIVSNNYGKFPSSQITQGLAEWGFNFALPLLCLTDEEDRYALLTGMGIYEAALVSGLDKIWAVLIWAKKPEAEKAVEPMILQSKLNEWVISDRDLEEFLGFLNNPKSDLTVIRGIGDRYAQKIVANRPYSSQVDMYQKLGPKLGFNWLKAFKQWKISV